jgi:hypothetical protein
MAQHGRAGFFGFSQRFEGRAADHDGARFLMMDRTPGRHEAGSSVKAGTAAALIADHERKAVPAPYFHVRDGTNDASELHGIPAADLRPRLDLPTIKPSERGAIGKLVGKGPPSS